MLQVYYIGSIVGLSSELNPGYSAIVICAIERKLRKYEFSSDLHNLCTMSLEETHIDGTRISKSFDSGDS